MRRAPTDDRSVDEVEAEVVGGTPMDDGVRRGEVDDDDNVVDDVDVELDFPLPIRYDVKPARRPV